MDVLRLLNIERSVLHIELGWHLTVLQKKVLPAIREVQFLSKQCTDALTPECPTESHQGFRQSF